MGSRSTSKRLPRHLRNEDIPRDTFTPRTYQVFSLFIMLKILNTITYFLIAIKRMIVQYNNQVPNLACHMI